MRLFLVSFTLLFLGLYSQGSVLKPSLLAEADYQSGVSLCGAGTQIALEEEGEFIQVPIDYSHPELGSTPIYYHWANKFDPLKPTLVFFDGGPGETSHGGVLSFDFSYNVLNFDQRGIACSRPKSFQLYRDASFYSSENTARDAEELRKHLGLAKWSVYGVSYGTIPATIYASLFSSSTQAVVLEGVVFSGDQALWTAPHRRKLLQRLLNNLPTSAQVQVAQFADRNNLPPEWFSLLARGTLAEDDGLAKLKEILLHLTGPEGEALADMLHTSLSTDSEAEEKSAIFDSDSTVYGMISCLELGFLDPQASPFDDLEGLTLVTPPNGLAQSYCGPLGIAADQASRYQAIRYPLSVPVTYFQGGDDGATDAPLAIQHYKQVPRAQAQLLISPRGGHTPNMNLLYAGSILQRRVLELALQGSLIDKTILQQLKEQENHFWAFTSK